MDTEDQSQARPVVPQQIGVCEPPGFFIYSRMNPTAILFDGDFFLKRLRGILGLHTGEISPSDAAAMASAVAENHAWHFQGELYRIFFYDCAPFTGTVWNPLLKKDVDYSKTPLAKFRTELHHDLRKRRKMALRLGYLRKGRWYLTERTLDFLLKGKIERSDIQDSDIRLEFEQKAVDMKIGLDISSIAMKGRVRTIVLVSGDSDFIPAAKAARREGVDFILDNMGQHVSESLVEHVDGVRCAPIEELWKRFKP